MSRVNIALDDLDAGYKSVLYSPRLHGRETDIERQASSFILRACMDERQASSFSDRIAAAALLKYNRGRESRASASFRGCLLVILLS